MDSKVVNKRIRNIIRPYLKTIGFSQFTSRSAWRYRERKIDVINFQSFNSILAESLGCTTYSFALNIGCFFTDIPSPSQTNPIQVKNGALVPEEYRCHFRRTLPKRLRQSEYRRPDIWYIDPSGHYLEPAIADALQVITIAAEPWFKRYESLDQVLSVLMTGEEKDGDTFGFGANPSPIRHYFTGFIASALDKPELVVNHLQAALDSGLFDNIQSYIQAEIEKVRG